MSEKYPTLYNFLVHSDSFGACTQLRRGSLVDLRDLDHNVGTPDIYLYFLFLQNRQKIGICISEIQIDQNVKIHTKSQTTLIIKTFQINYLNNQKKKLFFSKKYIYGGQKRARALSSSEPLGSGAEGALLYMQ